MARVTWGSTPKESASIFAELAQLAERCSSKSVVEGSIPLLRSTMLVPTNLNGSWAFCFAPTESIG